MQYLIYGLVSYILLQTILYAVLFHKLYRLILQYPRYTSISSLEIPNYLLNFAQIHTKQLTKLGFVFCKYLKIEATVVGENCLALLFYDQKHFTYALAKISVIYNPSVPVDFSFYNFFDNDILLRTVNGFNNSIIDSSPRIISQNPCITTIEKLLQIHQRKYKILKEYNSPKTLSPPSFIKAIALYDADYLNILSRNKKIVRIPEKKCFRLSTKTIFQKVFEYQAHLNNNFFSDLDFKQNSISLESEVELFKQWQTRKSSHKNNLFLKLVIMLGSLMLFILAARLYFDWRSLWYLIGILLFHEFGHFTAMKMFGYCNTSIFFLPFLGAAVSGTKKNNSIAETVIVLLSGSIPGILLGLFLILVIPSHLYAIPNSTLIIKWLIGLNFLNLLPILPLDGGKVVNLLLFSFHPYGEVIFKILTIVFLVAASIFWQEPVLISLSVLLIITIPRSWKIAKIAQYLPKSPASKTKLDQQLADIFHAILRAKYQRLQYELKFSLVQDILKQEQMLAGYGSKICWLCFYLACLIMGIWATKIA